MPARLGRALLALAGLCFMVSPALAAEGLDGAALGVLWAVPFVGILPGLSLFFLGGNGSLPLQLLQISNA